MNTIYIQDFTLTNVRRQPADTWGVSHGSTAYVSVRQAPPDISSRHISVRKKEKLKIQAHTYTSHYHGCPTLTKLTTTSPSLVIAVGSTLLVVGSMCQDT
jgi:hypothetical protein